MQARLTVRQAIWSQLFSSWGNEAGLPTEKYVITSSAAVLQLVEEDIETSTIQYHGIGVLLLNLLSAVKPSCTRSPAARIDRC